ncbi:disabled homolog 2-like [Trichomycterus rosablanca]|uniref:disabled homolog 2-like n=1 Tax=Trichomycterus rosablanca TaxID=2290929 RepID=UPI002F35062B
MSDYFLSFYSNQLNSLLKLELTSVIDANQNHLKGNPFVSYPTVPCNTPNDIFSSFMDMFPTPSPDPFSNDPFVTLNGQIDSSIFHNLSLSSNDRVTFPDCYLNGSDLDNHSVNELIDKFPSRNLNGCSNPFLKLSDQSPPVRNLFNKTVPLLQTPSPLCNGPSNLVHLISQPSPLSYTEAISPFLPNNGVIGLCPPPPSSKCGRVRRTEKVNKS